jgi:hypothetical protein
MKRWSIVPILLALCSSPVFAQGVDQFFSSDLVHWSYMQEPQQPETQPRQQPTPSPTPEPTPETQPSPNPTPSQHGQPAEPQQPSQNSTEGSQSQSATAQTFTGIVSKNADSYSLKVSADTSYKLDNQPEVQQFVGKRVRVTGTLDTSINLIHVDKIEPLS